MITGPAKEAIGEVQVLRTFVPESRRQRAIKNLCTKYREGRATATDVVAAMAACAAQCRPADAAEVLVSSVRAVRPVPLILATWTCEHPELFDFRAWRSVVRSADAAWTPALRRALRDPIARAAVAYESDHPKRDWARRELAAYLGRAGGDVRGI